MTDNLTAEQQAAVELVASDNPPRVATITGGPGTGKSYVTRHIVEALGRLGRTVALCAPSGKAAKRLAECTGRDATTIHRLLSLRPDVYVPEPVQAAVVIVDEASMVDIRLLASLARACFGGGGCVRTLLLVGDPDQLPPVGPGSPFLDLVAAAACRGVHLSEPQRAALDSGVVRAAYRIQEGKPPEWSSDFQLVECVDPEMLASTVWQLAQAVERDHGAGTCQVLSPQRTRGGGCDELNAYIDRAHWVPRVSPIVPTPGSRTCAPTGYQRADSSSPPGSRGGGRERGLLGDAATRHGGDALAAEAYAAALVREFRVGSRVIHTKNNRQLGIFNGETGTVTRTLRGQKKDGKPAPRLDELTVELDDGRDVEYRGAVIGQLQLAWALTVHKYQGSELENIIAVVHPSHSYMLTRALLYVAVTRASKRVWVVGTQAAVDRAVSVTKDLARETNLATMLAPEAVA